MLNDITSDSDDDHLTNMIGREIPLTEQKNVQKGNFLTIFYHSIFITNTIKNFVNLTHNLTFS